MSDNQIQLEKLFCKISKKYSHDETNIIFEYENFMRSLVKHCQCLFCGELIKKAIEKND